MLLTFTTEAPAMQIAAKIDEFGKPAWIALVILGFIFWWPLGLAVLAYLMWSGRMGCWKHGGVARWDRGTQGVGTWWQPRSSGNRAFDEYRTETLRRLEEEQREFQEFLDRLRFAKDKTEFDQFMAERRARSEQAPAQPQS
jgi:Protein of unknown function (DUF2852)